MDRRKLIQDESSHWYLIPVELEQEFYHWMDAMDEGGMEWNGYDFDYCRIDGPHRLVITAWEEE